MKQKVGRRKTHTHTHQSDGGERGAGGLELHGVARHCLHTGAGNE